MSPLDITIQNQDKDICPDCKIKMQPEGGCFICHNCGYSPCY